MARITLNGIEQEVPDNIYLIEAAKRCGVEIPHYCYHPGLSVEGNCRMCAVEIEGMPKVQTACTTYVQDGMVVNTEGEKVVKERSEVMEFLLRNHPIDCPICDQAGECGLQQYYMKHGLHDSRISVAEKVKKRKKVDLGPLVVLDTERCILCSRCVRFCREVSGDAELVIANRGNRSEITTFPGKELSNSYSLNTVDICPVGALTSRRFRFRCRVWFMKSTPSICPGCERGCNIHLDQFQNEIQRLRPRENLEVNGYWMCDEGRLDFEWVNENRLLRAEGRGGSMRRGEVDEAIAGALASASSVLIVASPRMTNENLYALRQFREIVLPGCTVVGGSFREKWRGDGLLRLPDRNPNRRGMAAIGFEGDVERELGKDYDAALIVENDLLGDRPELTRLIAGKTVITLASNKDETAGASTFQVPVTTYAEMPGSFTNFAGTVQSFGPAIKPLGEARPVYEVLSSIARAAGCDLMWASFAALQDEMAGKIPSLQKRMENEGRGIHGG